MSAEQTTKTYYRAAWLDPDGYTVAVETRPDKQLRITETTVEL